MPPGRPLSFSWFGVSAFQAFNRCRRGVQCQRAMAISSLPPSSIFQALTCRKGSKIDVHARTDGLHSQYNVTDADGVCGVFLVWSGSNLIQSQNLMSQCVPASRTLTAGLERRDYCIH